jgi:hypothetical protein
VTGPIASAFRVLSGNVDTANAGIPASVRNRGAEAGTEAGLIPGLIQAAFGDPTAMLFTIGAGIIQGLINGIRSLAGTVGGVIGGIVSGAINSARNALGLNDSQTPTYADSDFAQPGSNTALSIGGSVPVQAPSQPTERTYGSGGVGPTSVTNNNTYAIQSRAMGERSLVRELRDIEARPLAGRPTG